MHPYTLERGRRFVVYGGGCKPRDRLPRYFVFALKTVGGLVKYNIRPIVTSLDQGTQNDMFQTLQ